MQLGVPRCRLCSTTNNVEYCSMCGHYFCPTCKDKWPERFSAAVQEKIFRRRRFN